MLLYLVKSATCMAIFFLFYKFLLEEVQMHVFKRFYLLVALTASLVIPSLVFVEYVEPTITTSYTMAPVISEPLELNKTAQPTDVDIINWQLILWTSYGIGVFGFGFRFTRNLVQIIHRIRSNPKLRQQFSIKVLLQDKLPPHTFFGYVFLNKKKFEANRIPKEVLLHEEVHARQLHSLDVIFIELLQVFLWFNPMMVFFKKSIKLNHEFLADSAVLKETPSTSSYQNTLLSYLSENGQKKYQSIKMANAINYSSIKKRFKIMTTTTSTKARFLRLFLVFPLFALLLLGFSQTKTLPKEPVTNTSPILTITIQNSTDVWLNNKQVPLKDLAQQVLALSPTTAPKIEIHAQGMLEATFLGQIEKELAKTDPIAINVFADEYVMSRGSYQEKVDSTSNTVMLRTNKMTLVPDAHPLMANKGQKSLATTTAGNSFTERPYKDNPLIIYINGKGDLLVQEHLVPLENLTAFLTDRYTGLDKIQRESTLAVKIKVEDKTPKKVIKEVAHKVEAWGAATINIIGPPAGATKTQLAEYNALAKKYNNMDRNQMRILKKEVERLSYLFNVMTTAQKANAEPFPNFPEPPSVPTPPVPPLDKENRESPQSRSPQTGFFKVNGETLFYVSEKEKTTYFNRWGQKVDQNGEVLDPVQTRADQVIPGQVISKVYQDDDVVVAFDTKNIETSSATLKLKEEAKQLQKASKQLQKQSKKLQKESKHLQKDSQKLSEVPTPPMPPTPMHPLDHIIEMAKQGATFYYEGGQISSDKAIDLVKKNEQLDIDVTWIGSKKPRVMISKSKSN